MSSCCSFFINTVPPPYNIEACIGRWTWGGNTRVGTEVLELSSEGKIVFTTAAYPSKRTVRGSVCAWTISDDLIDVRTKSSFCSKVTIIELQKPFLENGNWYMRVNGKKFKKIVKGKEKKSSSSAPSGLELVEPKVAKAKQLPTDV
eukprot:g193.t1